jgi:hypothetical protein
LTNFLIDQPVVSSIQRETARAAIARAAQVDRTFFYRHRDLLAKIHTAAAEPGHYWR